MENNHAVIGDEAGADSENASGAVYPEPQREAETVDTLSSDDDGLGEMGQEASDGLDDDVPSCARSIVGSHEDDLCSLLNIKTFQIETEGITVEEDNHGTRIQVRYSPDGKKCIIAGLILMILSIGLLLLCCMDHDLTNNLIFVIFLGFLLFVGPFAVLVSGIFNLRSSLIIHIDDDENVTLSESRPFFATKSVTFSSDQVNRVYQKKLGKNFYLFIDGNDGKQYEFSSALTPRQQIWLLYTFSELFEQPPVPLGPFPIVSEFSNRMCYYSSNVKQYRDPQITNIRECK